MNPNTIADNSIIIGLCGRAGSGKSTAAKILCQDFGYTELSFAEPIKYAIASMLGVGHPDQLFAPEVKDDPIGDDLLPAGGNVITPRKLMQTLGTDWGRNMIDENLWASLLYKEIEYLTLVQLEDSESYKTPLRVVISDVRFPNEAAMIENLGGVIVKIQRNNQNAAQKNPHVSEQLIDRICPDYIIENKTLAGLKKSLRDICVQEALTHKQCTATAKESQR